jgi:eukaryotic-like serine/threonine-protein kinase
MSRENPGSDGSLRTLAGTLTGEPSATLRRVSGPSRFDSVDALLASLCDVVVLHETLGVGGMGVVRRGTQKVLAREVAVKCLRSPRVDVASLEKVLQEALVLAQLEHPNIVPVYDIALDESRLPRIVMKRVMGDEWSRFIYDDAAASDRAAGDLLRWHIDVFLQICNAVAYAHSRGIVHLDIKPSNVMLGPFGEVYLLDWGIAMTLRDDADPRIPRLSQCRETIGTPRYMAPEMLEGDGECLGTFTDIYLLGATLFEIVTKRPPHRGKSMIEVLTSIIDEEPAPATGCPAELESIIKRCLARDPSQRPASVQALARSVQDFLHHRHSARRCAEADERRAELAMLVSTSDADETRIYECFGAARFGYATALEAWPDNEVARVGRRAAVEQVVRWELRRDRPAAATAALATDPDPDPELRLEVDSARDAALQRERQLSSLGRQHDPRLGQRTRLFFTNVLGFSWFFAAAVAWMIGNDPTRDPLWIISVTASAILLPSSALVWWARESLMKTAINRGTVVVIGLVVFSQLIVGLLAYPLALSMAQVQVVIMVLYAFGATVVTALIEPRTWPTAVAYALGAAYLAAVPTSRNAVLVVTNLVFWINSSLVWRLTWSEIRERRRR